MDDNTPVKVVSYRRMGPFAGTFHACMLLLTAGLWTPVFLWARRGRRTVTWSVQ